MAIVPRYPQQAETQALPGVRVGAQATPQAFGGGMVREAAQGFGDLQEIARQEERRADQLARQDADNTAARVQKSLEVEAFQKKGKDSFGEPERVLAEFDRHAGEITGTLTTPRQKQEFQQYLQLRRDQLNDSVQRHVFAERQRYDQDQTQATVGFATDNMVAHRDNPERLQVEALRLRAAVETHGERQGLPRDAIKAAADKAESDAWRSVIAGALDAGDDREAAALYQQRKDWILPTDRGRLERALEIGSTAGESQRRADGIMAKATTLGEALEQVRTIDDPKLRDATNQRVKAMWQENEAARAEKRGQLQKDIFNIVAAKGTTAAVPTGMLVDILDGPDGREFMDGMEKFAKRLNMRDPPPENSERYYMLLRMSAADPEAFKGVNLLGSAGDVAPGQLKQLMDRQATILGKREESAAEKKKWSGVESRHDQVRQNLVRAGLPPEVYTTKDGEQKFNEPTFKFLRQYDRLVDAAGGEVTREESQKIIDMLLFEHVQTKTELLDGMETRADIVVRDGQTYAGNVRNVRRSREVEVARFRGFEAPNADRMVMRADQITDQNFIKEVIARFRAKKQRDPTEDEIVGAYNHHLSVGGK